MVTHKDIITIGVNNGSYVVYDHTKNETYIMTKRNSKYGDLFKKDVLRITDRILSDFEGDTDGNT